MMLRNFHNLPRLVWFMLKRERISSTIWIFLLALIVGGLVPMMYEMVVAEGIESLSSMMENPAMVAMLGPPITLINNTFGALYTNMMHVFTAITVGIMNIFLVVRHSRGDEELGRFEVLRSLPVGRLANIGAVLDTAAIVNIALSLVMGLVMFAFSPAEMTFGGSMLFAASLGAFGLVMAATTAVFCQLTASAKSAVSYSFIALAGFYFLRALGDMQNATSFIPEAGGTAQMSIISLLSPLGLSFRTYAFAGDYWWPIAVLLFIAVALAAIALKLASVRDIGRGLLPERPGKAHGGRLLRRPGGLTFRLTRNILIGFVVGVFLLGASYASVMGGIDEFIAGNEMYQNLILSPAEISLVRNEETGQVTAYLRGEVFRILDSDDQIVELMHEVIAHAGFTLTEMFASTISGLMAFVSLVPGLLVILKMKAEERAERGELILATSTCRVKHYIGYIAIAMVSVAVMQFALGLGLYATASAILPAGALGFGFVMSSSMVYVPALWLITAVLVLIFGAVPKLSGAIWGYFGFCFLIMFIGRMGVLPAAVGYISPVEFVPILPVESVNWLPLSIKMLVTAILTTVGIFAYTKRDIAVR